MTFESSFRTSRLLAVAVYASVVLMAQTETATISGLVTDPSGAGVARAEILLQNVDRGTKTQIVSNDSGLYAFPSVVPGKYQITVQKQGFKQVDLLDVIVNVQDHIQQNFSLQVGSVSESVTVEGRAKISIRRMPR
jgi:hypothetical protein